MRKRILFVLIILSLFLIPTTNRPPVAEPQRPLLKASDPWATTYGGSLSEGAESVQQTSDGGFIVAGSQQISSSSNCCDDAWVLRLDSSGGVLWQKTYGGSGREHFNSVQQTSDGGFIVAGDTDSFGCCGAWVLRLDASGGIIWQKTYVGGDGGVAYSVRQTSDGGFIVAGIISPFGSGDLDAWILRLDTSGDIVWQKRYGGGNTEYALSVEQTSDSGFIVAGQTLSFGAGGYDAWVLRLDSSGNLVWQVVLGSVGADAMNSVAQTSDGGFIAAGVTVSPGFGGLGDAWLLRLDASGGVIWQKTYGGTADEGFESVLQTPDGGFMAAGTSNSFPVGYDDFWALRLDSSGGIVWQKTYGGKGNSVLQSAGLTNDNGFILAGSTDAFGAGGSDAWVLRLDAAGQIGTRCGPIADSNATVTNTAATITIPPVTGIDTTATVTTTNATVTVPHISTHDQCKSSTSTVFPDVAASAIFLSRGFAYSGVSSNPVIVNVTAVNAGTVSETFIITAKANSTLIGSENVTLVPGASQVVSFNWNPGSLPRGHYTITSNASTVSGETDLSNNNLTWEGLFTVKLKGDVNGDCTVDISDLAITGASNGKTPSTPGYSSFADINNDGNVDISDIVLVASSFGQHC